MNENNTSEQETMSADERQVRQMLASLKRVEAPANFSFRVKGRIAQRSESPQSRRWMPASAAVAAPLGLMLAVGGYFALTTAYSPVTVQEPAITEIKPALLPAYEPSVSVSVPENPVTVSGTPVVFVRNTGLRDINTADRSLPVQPPVRRTNSVRPPVTNGGGSFDEASGVSREVTVGAKDVLSHMGVAAILTGTAWTVGGVRPNSRAARSGLKAGDVVEAIDEREMKAGTSFEGNFAGRTLRVRRDGKVLQVDLKH